MAQKRISKGASAPIAIRVKTSVILDREAYKTLGAASLWLDKDNSELMQMLIKEHLSEYAVTKNGRKTDGPVIPSTYVESANDSHQINLSASPALLG